uniref:Uncharacterized protein n=1 Tax=Strongyloides venezuelensis TaxID=75913 RepID=A0A0K0EZD9_STRVS
MPLAFANQNQNQTGVSNTSGISNEGLWSNNFNCMMSQNKRPPTGIKRRLCGDNVYGDEPPALKKCFNEKDGCGFNSDSSIFCSKLQNMNIHINHDDTSKALIPVTRNSNAFYDNDDEMEQVDVVNNINFPSTSDRFFRKSTNQFPLIPSHLIQGNEIVLFTPEHPIDFYKNIEDEEGGLRKNDYDRNMEGRIEELPNDYEVENGNNGMAVDGDYSNIFVNGIHPPFTNVSSCVGVVELAEDDCNDLSRDSTNISNLSHSSTPFCCTSERSCTEKGKSVTATTTTDIHHHLSHGPIFEELSDEDYCDDDTKPAINDSPMEID